MARFFVTLLCALLFAGCSGEPTRNGDEQDSGREKETRTAGDTDSSANESETTTESEAGEEFSPRESISPGTRGEWSGTIELIPQPRLRTKDGTLLLSVYPPSAGHDQDFVIERTRQYFMPLEREETTVSGVFQDGTIYRARVSGERIEAEEETETGPEEEEEEVEEEQKDRWRGRITLSPSPRIRTEKGSFAFFIHGAGSGVSHTDMVQETRSQFQAYSGRIVTIEGRAVGNAIIYEARVVEE